MIFSTKLTMNIIKGLTSPKEVTKIKLDIPLGMPLFAWFLIKYLNSHKVNYFIKYVINGHWYSKKIENAPKVIIFYDSSYDAHKTYQIYF